MCTQYHEREREKDSVFFCGEHVDTFVEVVVFDDDVMMTM